MILEELEQVEAIGEIMDSKEGLVTGDGVFKVLGFECEFLLEF